MAWMQYVNPEKIAYNGSSSVKIPNTKRNLKYCKREKSSMSRVYNNK